MGDLEASVESTSVETAKFDLSFSVKERAEDLALEIEYNSDLFEKTTIERMSQHYLKILEEAIKTPEEKIDKLAILTNWEKEQLQNFNHTEIDYPKNKTILDLLEAQRAKTPHKTAIIFENNALTYQELTEKSNQLGHFLSTKGVQKGTLVGICLDRSLEMMIGILGILKAGGAYVPIDPYYPKARISYLLEDAELHYLIVDNASTISDKQPLVERINIVEDWHLIEQFSKESIGLDLTSDSLAYVIYTSGSTGRPKGVMNQHDGVVNRLLWAQDYFKLDAAVDVILQKTTFCFDVSVWELFWPLIAGIKLVFAKPEGHKDNVYLRSLINQAGITTIHFCSFHVIDFFI